MNSSINPAPKTSHKQNDPVPVPAASMVVAMATNGMPHNDSSLQEQEVQSNYNYWENGREYHGFSPGKYLFPCDEAELDRMDIYHKFFSVARRGVLYSAPITPSPSEGPRILDVGTGTGIWAIDICDKLNSAYQKVQIEGMDLSFLQPREIPQNLRFDKRDFESPWHGIGLDHWDLIHMRMLNGGVGNWPDLYSKVYRHLKPGTGWLEHIEIDMIPRCDDDTLPPNSNLVKWSQHILSATQEHSRPLAYNTQTRSMLEHQGFVEIQEQVIKVPFNPWPTDTHLKDIGRWYNLGLTQGLDALTLGPMTTVRHWKKPDIDKLIQDAKREICSKHVHAYCNMHIWIARRPSSA